MNRIFKKIWNKHRGSFVAVSEAMTSASQRAGKTTAIIGLSLIVSQPANALITVGSINSSSMSNSGGSHNILSDSYLVNGNLNVDKHIAITWVANEGSWTGQSVTVTGDAVINSGVMMEIAHKGGHGSASPDGIFTVNGNLTVDGELDPAIGNHNSTVILYPKLVVGNTLVINGLMRNDLEFDNAQISINAKNLEVNGQVDFQKGAGNLAFENLLLNSGSYAHNANFNTWVSGTLSLFGGTLINPVDLVVGQQSGAFSAGHLLLAGGVLTNRTLLSQTAGSVSVTAGNYTFGTLNKSNGTLSNAGTLTVTNFNQSNGASINTGNLTIGNANLYGSLSNTGTLNLTGTVTSRGNLSSSGTVNNKGSWTETNTYAISGNLNNTGSVNFQNGFTLVSNSRLTSSGTLQTNNVYNIFDSLGTTGQQDLHYVSLNSTVPQEVKTSLSDFFQKYVAGTVAQDLINHASFTGGKVIITGVNITQTQADDLVSAFKSKIYSPLEQLKTAHLSTFHFRKVLG